MCGRFNVTDSALIQEMLRDLNIDVGPLPVRYNIAPTEAVATIFLQDNAAVCKDMRWWLTPNWSDGPSQKFAMFNARAETIDTSRAYRQPFKSQRAIVCANSFVEWQSLTTGTEGDRSASGVSKKTKPKKQAFEIAPATGAFAFAAIWDHWQGETAESIYSCSIVTNESSPAFRHIHSRQPVMLTGENIQQWLKPETPSNQLKSMLLAPSHITLTATPIDNSIGNARNKAPCKPSGEPITLKPFD